MKCTQCGCNELTLVRAPFSADYFTTSENLKIYACNKCGHLEFFENSWNETREALKNELQLLESRQKELLQEIEKKEMPIVELKSKLQDTEIKLNEVLANKDITVRQQESMSAELKAKIEALNSEIKRISRDHGSNTGTLHFELQNIEQEIARTKKQLEEPRLKFARMGI